MGYGAWDLMGGKGSVRCRNLASSSTAKRLKQDSRLKVKASGWMGRGKGKGREGEGRREKGTENKQATSRKFDLDF
jgi:hypothetical protein